MDKTLLLEDGSRVVVEDVLGQSLPKERKNRNLYRISAEGTVIWRVSGPLPQSDDDEPYTNVYFGPDGSLRAYNWNGGEYGIELQSGQAAFRAFLK